MSPGARPLLTMLTTFRAKALAANWQHHCTLLDRAIGSMLANTGDFQVIVVCHDLPDISHHDQRLRFVQVDIPIPCKLNYEMCVDKVVKLSIGIRKAQEDGCDYIMFSDADDLVSNRVSEFVAQNRGPPGWFCDTQLYHRYGNKTVRLIHIPPPQVGCSVIVRSDCLDFESSPFGHWASSLPDDEAPYLQVLASRGCQVNTLAAIGHPFYSRYMDQRGTPLCPMPFPIIMVIEHYDSISHFEGGPGSAVWVDQRPLWRQWPGRAKNLARQISKTRLLTPSLRREFGASYII